MEWKEEFLFKNVEKEIVKKIKNDFFVFLDTISHIDTVMFYFGLEKNLTSQEIEELFPQYQVKTYLNRLKDKEYIEVISKDGKYNIYKLTDIGNSFILNKLNVFLDKNSEYKDFKSNIRKDKVNNINTNNKIKTILNCIIDANINLNEFDKLVIDVKELSMINYEVTELLYADFYEVKQIIKQYFNEQDPELKLENEDISFINVHESVFNPIHRLDMETKELIFTKGLITNKKEDIVSKTLDLSYLCDNTNCKYYEKKIIAQNSIKICPICKNSVNLVGENRINKLDSKLTDVETGISIHLEINGKLSSIFAKIELGDEIEVIGHLEDKSISINNMKKETQKVLIVDNFKRSDYIKELTKEQIAAVESKLSRYKTPETLLFLPFVNYIEQDFIKKIFIIQQLTRYNPDNRETPINIAMMGEPGVGKNELIRIGEKFFPNSDTIVGADITDAGFKGTVNRDTGIKEIGLAKKLQNGTLFFNEFDKFIKTNPNGKKGGSQLLNASITEQEIRLNKAGIRIRMHNLDLRHNVMFNPLDDKILNNKNNVKYENMKEIMDTSLLSRMIPLYVGKDQARSKKVFNLMLESTIKSVSIDEELYKDIIKYLRCKDVILDYEAKNVLKDYHDNINKQDKYNVISSERIGVILIQLCKGITRFYNKSVCDRVFAEEACSLYFSCLETCGINTKNLDSLFLDQTPEEIKETHDIKEYIRIKLKHSIELSIEELEKMFKVDNVIKTIALLKKNKFVYETKKGILRGVTQ